MGLDLPRCLCTDASARTSSASATGPGSASMTTATPAASSSTCSTTSASTTSVSPRAVLGAISRPSPTSSTPRLRGSGPGPSTSARSPRPSPSTNGAWSRPTPWTSTTSWSTVRLFRDHPRRARAVPGALRARARRRVPGHQPRPERARDTARRATAQRLRRRRHRPVHLPVPGRGDPQPARVRAGLPRCRAIVLDQNYRSTQTILDAANAVIGNNLIRQEKGALDRPRRGRADPPLPGRGRAGRGRRSSRARSPRCTATKRCATATSPSSTGPMPKAAPSSRRSPTAGSPTR